MILKDLGQILRGSLKFKLQERVDGNIITLDEVFIYEIQYLPACLLRRKVLEFDLDENIIFLDKDYNRVFEYNDLPNVNISQIQNEVKIHIDKAVDKQEDYSLI